MLGVLSTSITIRFGTRLEAEPDAESTGDRDFSALTRLLACSGELASGPGRLAPVAGPVLGAGGGGDMGPEGVGVI